MLTKEQIDKNSHMMLGGAAGGTLAAVHAVSGYRDRRTNTKWDTALMVVSGAAAIAGAAVAYRGYVRNRDSILTPSSRWGK